MAKPDGTLRLSTALSAIRRALRDATSRESPESVKARSSAGRGPAERLLDAEVTWRRGVRRGARTRRSTSGEGLAADRRLEPRLERRPRR